MAYEPEPVPEEYDELRSYIERELRRVSANFIDMQDFAWLRTLHNEPVKPREGIIVLADGSDWDPGSGAGYYGYYGGNWVKLG